MKNYIVMAIREFDDYEGQEIKPENPHQHRRKKDIFNCTKERYEQLLINGAVLLRGIEETPIKEEIQETETIDILEEEVKPKKTSKKKE